MTRFLLITVLIVLVCCSYIRSQTLPPNILSRIDSLNLVFDHMEKTDLEAAERIAREALRMASQSSYEKGEADARVNLGRIQVRQGNNKKALEYFFAALQLYETLDDFQNSEYYGAALRLVSSAFYFEMDYDRSLVYSQKTIAIAKPNNYQNLLGLAYRVRGEVFRDRQQFDSSLYYFNQALAAFIKTNSTMQIANIYIDIGVNYYYLGDYKQAIIYNKMFYKLARQLGLKTDYSIGLHNIGEFNYLLKSYTEALSYLDSAQYYGESFHQTSVLLDTYRVKAKVYTALAKTDSASAYYEKALIIKDSIYNDTYKKELASLQTQMDVYRHETENKILVKEKSIATLYRNFAIAGFVAIVSILALVLLRQKLRVQNAVKQKLEEEVAQRTSEIVKQNEVIENINLKLQLSLNRAKVDPHFIFNVLNSIQHLVLEKKPIEASDHLARLSRLARYILEKSSLDEVMLKEEVTMLEQYIRLEQLRLDHKFDYKITVNMPELTPLPAMLIQPYIENAIVHGLSPATGTGLMLHLSFEEKEGMIFIVIEDNGVGRLAKKKREGHHSMGSTLGKERLEILSRLGQEDYKMEINDLDPERDGSGGTQVILQIPLKIKQSA